MHVQFSVPLVLDTAKGGWGEGCFGWFRLSMELSRASNERVAFTSYVIPQLSATTSTSSSVLIRLLETCSESHFAIPIAKSLLSYVKRIALHYTHHQSTTSQCCSAFITIH